VMIARVAGATSMSRASTRSMYSYCPD